MPFVAFDARAEHDNDSSTGTATSLFLAAAEPPRRRQPQDIGTTSLRRGGRTLYVIRLPARDYPSAPQGPGGVPRWQAAHGDRPKTLSLQ